MKTLKIRSLIIVVTLFILIQVSSLKAQYTFSSPFAITGTGGTFQFGADGSLSVSGTTSNFNAFATEFLFNPNKASLSSGCGSSASGWYSTAFGCGSTASGAYSTASGFYSTASGFSSTALGQSVSALGDSSTALGFDVTASGHSSSAFGNGSTASGNYSTSSGFYSSASSMCSTAVGAVNVGGGDPSNWVETDPLFEVGNGINPSGSGILYFWGATPSDAFVVYKNGNAAVQGNFQVGGVVTVAAGGDIPMFSGTN